MGIDQPTSDLLDWLTVGSFLLVFTLFCILCCGIARIIAIPFLSIRIICLYLPALVLNTFSHFFFNISILADTFLSRTVIYFILATISTISQLFIKAYKVLAIHTFKLMRSWILHVAHRINALALTSDGVNQLKLAGA